MVDAEPCPCLTRWGDAWWDREASAHARGLYAGGLAPLASVQELKVWDLLVVERHRTFEVGAVGEERDEQRVAYRSWTCPCTSTPTRCPGATCTWSQRWVPAWCSVAERWLESRWRDRRLTPARVRRLAEHMAGRGGVVESMEMLAPERHRQPVVWEVMDAEMTEAMAAGFSRPRSRRST